MQRERHYKDDKLNAAAEELWSYRQKQFEIRRLKAKSEELRDRYSVGATAYDGIRVQGGVRKDKLVKIAVEWADLQNEILERTREAEHFLWEIESRLRALRSNQRQVLELYYIKGYSVVKIADMLGYSDEGIKTIKYQALKAYAYVEETAKFTLNYP
mgnify:CR=1 FL=1